MASEEPANSEERSLESLQAFLEETIRLAGFALAVRFRKLPAAPPDPDGPEWIVEFSGSDSGLLLEAHAELLEALAWIGSRGAHLSETLHHKVVFDCEDYRATRAAELRLTAQLAAERALETREPFALNPMSSAERRLVHLTLKNKAEVRTESQGAGAERHVVIVPVR
jgi:spoIIIJ-associated protein